MTIERFPVRVNFLSRYFTHIGKKYQDGEALTRKPSSDKAYSEIP